MITKPSRLAAVLALWCLLNLALIPSVTASTFQSGDEVHISPLHEIDDDFYAAGDRIKIEGIVTGDFLGVAANADIRGTIGGSLNLATRYTDHAGVVDGSLRWAGERLTVTGQVGGSVVAAGSMLFFRPGSVIEKDATLSGAELELQGLVKGKADLEAQSIRIGGQIHGDVTVSGEEIIISPPAIITGKLVYRTDREDQLTIEPGATVAGEVVWEEPEAEEADDSGRLSEIAFRIASLLAAFIFGAFMFAFVRPYAEESYQQIQNRLPASVAAGLLGLLGMILATIVLIFSLLGILVGSILLSGDLAALGLIVSVLSILMVPISSFVTVSGAVVLYSGKIVVGLWLGGLILGHQKRGVTKLSKTALLLGLIIVSLGAMLPYVGLIIVILTAVIGAGAIMLGIHTCRRGMLGSRVEKGEKDEA